MNYYGKTSIISNVSGRLLCKQWDSLTTCCEKLLAKLHETFYKWLADLIMGTFTFRTGKGEETRGTYC